MECSLLFAMHRDSVECTVRGLTSGVSNSKCSEGQMRTYIVTGGPHYDTDTMAVPEPYYER